MKRLPRVIPCLLLSDSGLVKTRKFKDPVYLGEPINILRIFNDKEVDELVLLDIEATVSQRKPSFDLLAQVAGECFMPLAYGGGLACLEDIEKVLSLGFEKVVLNTAALQNPSLVQEAARVFGSQAVVVSIDVNRNFWGKAKVATSCGCKLTEWEPANWAKKVEELGAGEILLNAVYLDGTEKGYDLELVRSLTEAVSIPVIACGGAGKVSHLGQVVKEAGASAAAAGSLFVFHGVHRAVLINVPSASELQEVF